MVIRGETALGDYLRSSQSDFSKIMEESFTDLQSDLINMNFKVRELCKRLSVQTSVTKTSTFTGTITSQDYAQRRRLVITVTDCDGEFGFTLQGSDDDGTTYYDVSIVADDSGSSISFTSSGESSFLINDLYKKYRLNIISAGTTITYSAYMIEEIYTSLHRDRTRANIYRSLIRETGDNYENKYNLYENLYKEKLMQGKFIVDYDTDGSISESEGEQHILQDIRFYP